MSWAPCPSHSLSKRETVPEKPLLASPCLPTRAFLKVAASDVGKSPTCPTRNHDWRSRWSQRGEHTVTESLPSARKKVGSGRTNRGVSRCTESRKVHRHCRWTRRRKAAGQRKRKPRHKGLVRAETAPSAGVLRCGYAKSYTRVSKCVPCWL